MIFWDERDYVEMLYRQLLGRAADQPGLTAHLQAFDGGAGTQQAEDLLQRFLTSEEARRRFRVALLPDLLKSRSPADDRPALVASLGTDAYASALLQRWGLKRFQGPFDWILSSPAMLAHCLQDDFAALLDPGQYEAVPVERRPHGPDQSFCEHRLYRDTFGVRYVFNHFDPRDPKVHAHLTVAAQNFRRLLAAEAPKLLVCVAPADRFPDAEHAALAEAIGSAAKAVELKLLRVESSDPFLVATRITETRRTATVTSYRVEPLSARTAVDFVDPFDDIAIAKAVLAGPGRLKPLDLPA